MLKLNWIKKTVLIVALSLVIGCGSSDDETNNIPAPYVPYVPPDGDLPIVNPPTTSSELPDLSAAVPVDLADKVNYSALDNIASDYAPLPVGDQLVSMNLELDGGHLTGSILFAFEDQIGFWGAIIQSFGATGQLNNGNMDIIFADDELVLRASATLSGSVLNGVLFYRVRQAGEDACKPVIVYCDTSTQNTSNYWWYPAPTFPEECTQTPNTDTPCMSYMNSGLSQVNTLGSFNSTYSGWVR